MLRRVCISCTFTSFFVLLGVGLFDMILMNRDGSLVFTCTYRCQSFYFLIPPPSISRSIRWTRTRQPHRMKSSPRSDLTGGGSVARVGSSFAIRLDLPTPHRDLLPNHVG